MNRLFWKKNCSWTPSMIRLVARIDVINFFASIKIHELKLLHLRFLLETGGKSDEAGNRGGRNLEAGNPENVKSADMNRLAVHCTVCKLTLSGLKVSYVRTSLSSRCLKRQSVPGVAWILGIESWEIVTFFLFTLKQTKSYFTDLLNTQTI